MSEEALPPELLAAIKQFVHWSTQQLEAEQAATRITTPLYHYTNATGLRGIIESQKFWFTSYRHLNDPSELTHGMDIAHRLLVAIAEQYRDGLVKIFCEMVDDLFKHGNFADVFGFYIASLSRAGNDLGQWRAYADNGRGFALGLAPHLFEMVEDSSPAPTEHIILPVVYGKEADARYCTAIEAAAAVVQGCRPHLKDQRIGIPFMRELANQLIAGQLIGISLGVKHEAYRHEQEVWLVILGTQNAQRNDVKTRVRGAEIVPYMESPLPLRDKDGITDIVIGPAAPSSTKDAVHSLLRSFGVDPNGRIRESGIPYRAL